MNISYVQGINGINPSRDSDSSVIVLRNTVEVVRRFQKKLLEQIEINIYMLSCVSVDSEQSSPYLDMNLWSPPSGDPASFVSQA